LKTSKVVAGAASLLVHHPMLVTKIILVTLFLESLGILRWVLLIADGFF